MPEAPANAVDPQGEKSPALPILEPPDLLVLHNPDVRPRFRAGCMNREEEG